MRLKKGITMAMLAVMIAVLGILATVTVTSISNSYTNSKLAIWTAEISVVQDLVKEKRENLSNILMDEITFDVSNISQAVLTEQFSGETITSNKIKLKEVNLAAIDVDNAIYGVHKEKLDVYAYSELTGKVYYLKGFDARIKEYYTLTEELKNKYGDNLTVSNLSVISFEQSEIEPTMNPVKVTVKVPKAYTSVSIVTTNSSITIGSRVTETDKYTYLVNNNGITGNYTIVVKYTDGGIEKTVSHKVTNAISTIGALVTNALDYGKTVDYVSDNGVTKWNVLYEDTTNKYVYLIATEKLAASKIPTIPGAVVTSSAVTIENGTSKNVGQIRWTSIPTGTTVASDAKTKWKAEWSSYSSGTNTKCISYFLDETYWTGLKNTTAAYKDYVLGAIGTPTAELFVLSWNAKRAVTNNTTIYNKQITLTARSATTGYYVKDASVSTNTYLQALTTGDKLYVWNNSELSTTWLASPGAVTANYILIIGSTGNLSYDTYSSSNRGIRPVVCLKSDTPAVLGTTTDYSLIK